MYCLREKFTFRAVYESLTEYTTGCKLWRTRLRWRDVLLYVINVAWP